ncbi:glutathione S-transferase N-terminal domain-containing protein [soil metagenome]
MLYDPVKATRRKGMPETIQLYYWPTPNGHKISIFLEEAELPYEMVPVDIGAGDQFEDEFLRISPNNKMPAIVDPDGPDGEPISLFESGAILIYLAEKSGAFLPRSPRQRYVALQWLMFQMGHVGPMLGQAHHFRQYADEEIPYAIERYTNEASRLYRVMDRRLSETEYFVGDEYTIADIAIFPWLRSYERQGQKMEDYPNLNRWFEGIGGRPAVQRALQVGEDLRRDLKELDQASRDRLFGRTSS